MPTSTYGSNKLSVYPNTLSIPKRLMGLREQLDDNACQFQQNMHKFSTFDVNPRAIKTLRS